MKAILISEHGDEKTLQYGDVSTPPIEPNTVLIKLHAAALNHVDIWVRNGGPAYPVKLPHILGADGAGVVEAAGSEVEGVSVGDRVLIIPGLSCGQCEYCRTHRDNQCDRFEILGAKRWGTYAEYVAVPDDNVLILPDHISFEDAAAFPLAYLTAWHMLIGRGQLSLSETILVVGASSGVSIAAIQIAKMKGARILAVTTNPDKAVKIKNLGADEVHILDAAKGFADWALQQTKGKGVNLVLEHVGPATWEHSIRSLAKYGRVVTCGATTGPVVSVDLRTVFSRDLSILGARMGTKKEFQELAELVFSGQIKPVIDKIFPLSEAAKAHAHMEARQQIGKILLKTT